MATRLRSVALAALVAFGAPVAVAQTSPASGEAAAPKLKPEQLDALVAPIALYPDPLLSQALMASTYPLEIIQAQQWLAKNPKLKGDALEKAIQAQPWEPSVQATATMPDLLKRLGEDITWTTNLGNAFLAQQEEVMDAVQRLRLKAKNGGKLTSNDKMVVETQVVEKETVVVIQQANPQVVYVPAYNPTVIWGPPPVYYPYPPVYYPPPPPPGAMLFSFGVGMAMGAAIHGGYCCGCGWGHGGGNTVVINNNNNFVNNSNRVNNISNSGNSNWSHNSSHRGGAPYGDRATQNKYGGSGNRSGSAQARPTAPSMDRGGGGGNQIGNQSVRPSSGGSGFGGSSSGASRAQASSSRGGSSMQARPSGGGGGSRGGGGGRGGGGRR